MKLCGPGLCGMCITYCKAGFRPLQDQSRLHDTFSSACLAFVVSLTGPTFMHMFHKVFRIIEVSS